MLTFSLNTVNGADAYAAKVWHTINSNLGYFKYFNKDRWEEAVHHTFLTALNHRDKSYDNILPYIKKLARTILKVKSREISFPVHNEDGEIAPIYYSLADFIDEEKLDGTEELKDIFKELYLMDSESFMRLKALYQYNDVTDVESFRDIRIRNSPLGVEFRRLIDKYGSTLTFQALYEFFKELPYLCMERKTGLTKEVNLKAPNYSVLDRIPDTPTIQDVRGNYHFIDKTTLTMAYDTGRGVSVSNPDYFKWDIVGSSTCDILKIDISPFMNYMYEEVYVDEGVSTKHITWCGDKYRLETPGGLTHIGLELDKYLSVVRIELVLNLMSNNIGSVVAVSPDSVYIKPTRAFQFDNIRIRLKSGKIMDLPITLHIRKRNRRK